MSFYGPGPSEACSELFNSDGSILLRRLNLHGMSHDQPYVMVSSSTKAPIKLGYLRLCIFQYGNHT